MAYDVFISYSSKDKLAADAACATLEAQGIRCWIAPRDILPGQEWGASIVKAIAEAKVFVLLLSASANASPQISREVERAVNHAIPVIPVRLEDVTPTASLEYFINTPHWLDAFKPPLDDHLNYLARVVRTLMEGGDTPTPPKSAPPAASPEAAPPPASMSAPTSTPTPAAAAQPAPAPPPRPGSLMPVLIGVIVVALLAILALAAWKFIPRSGPTATATSSGATPTTTGPGQSTDVAAQASIAPQVDPACLAQAPSQPSVANCQAMLNQSQTWEGCAASYAQADIPALTERARSLINQGQSGVDLYEASPEFKAYGTISHYWEMLSQCVHDGELSYNDMGSGVPFPDSFWDKTRPLRAVIGQNWQGANQALPDFMSNFEFLCQQYKAGRNAERPGGGDSLDCSS